MDASGERSIEKVNLKFGAIRRTSSLRHHFFAQVKPAPIDNDLPVIKASYESGAAHPRLL